MQTRIHQSPTEDRQVCKIYHGKVDPALGIRNVCTVGLALGWIFASTCLIAGSIMISSDHVAIPPYVRKKVIMVNFFLHSMTPEKPYPHSHRIQQLRQGTSVLVQLLLNLLVTIILDTTNYIHATTLRWALFDEGRLEFNSYVRLFTRAHAHGPNSWYMNLISLIGLAIAYGATSSAITDVVVVGQWNEQTQLFDYGSSESSDIIDINGLAILALGVGVFLQVSVSTFSLLRTGGVRTWNNSLLANAKAWLNGQDEKYAVSQEASSKIPFTSRVTQDTMLSIAPHVQLARRLIWGFCALFTVWSLAQGIVTVESGYMTENFNDFSTGVQAYWRFYGAMYFDFKKLTKSPPYWLGLIIQIIVQSFLTFALHCVELLFNLSRDEAAWRDMESVGSEVDPSWKSNFSWQTLIMLAMKAVIQWVFGYALTADVSFNIALLPIIALMVLFIGLAIASEYMVKKKPKGTLPASYGKFNRVIQLVDDWDHVRLFWGDKGCLKNGMARAGTAGRRLPDLQPDTLYYCLEREA
ncbi:uncharacterized protein N7482_002951 [Penicillium canariense]|uniref:Uncharacterized protein n=1 Tax=Penicillium canariense TaxID=189055 RepID=A0A9W9IIP9_9EURO|nr:uncharacterized protein N7482_002951 [Penicillium canariense]KAJ5177074.1 hypothetical protein N7482_002951 [Penicillium canariense]